MPLAKKKTPVECSATFPMCTKKSCVVDIYGSVVNKAENTLFHSVSEQEPLIDFIYKSGKIYYAMQVTIGKSHDAAAVKIAIMMNKLEVAGGFNNGEKVFLCYLVPEFHFKEFVTAPVEPKVEGGAVNIVSIPNPCKEETQ